VELGQINEYNKALPIRCVAVQSGRKVPTLKLKEPVASIFRVGIFLPEFTVSHRRRQKSSRALPAASESHRTKK
jgi:hypothetical protein